MPPRRKGHFAPERSEGVQIRIDPALKHQARIYLTRAEMTWQDLLEPCIRHFVDAAETPAAQTPPEPAPLPMLDGPGPHPPQPIDMTAILRDATSVEVLLGSATYRRWIHRCGRCQRCWVAELATPAKCLHCKSPYWNTPRTRRIPDKRGISTTPSGKVRARLPQ
jgi:hypothetical protein